MELQTWIERLTAVCDTARYLHGLNVVDLSFESGIAWEVYWALDDNERSRGLADLALEHLDADGMLFYYPGGSYVPFSAAKMQFPLHMAWYDDQGAPVHGHMAAAGALSPICCPRRFTWVLESPHPIPPGSLKVRHGA